MIVKKLKYLIIVISILGTVFWWFLDGKYAYNYYIVKMKFESLEDCEVIYLNRPRFTGISYIEAEIQIEGSRFLSFEDVSPQSFENTSSIKLRQIGETGFYTLFTKKGESPLYWNGLEVGSKSGMQNIKNIRLKNISEVSHTSLK